QGAKRAEQVGAVRPLPFDTAHLARWRREAEALGKFGDEVDLKTGFAVSDGLPSWKTNNRKCQPILKGFTLRIDFALQDRHKIREVFRKL
ncbi:MAG TPA: hypothetical protein VJW76_13955, partial [Verrucomicrobiae bacterium]|nr:hypothetical protein [Verrucomicrobiae bacterium]